MAHSLDKVIEFYPKAKKMRIRTLFIFIVLSSWGFAQNSIDQAIATFAESAGLENASISFQVVSLDDKGASISAHNGQVSLPTASTAKLFSTATALDILGSNYRAKTRVYYDGYIDSNGVLHGNLWVRGGGDPSLGSKYFNEEKNALDFMHVWADSLIKLGVKRVNGSLIADASEFGYEGAPDGWNWVDMGNYYGAGPSGLTLYDNLVRYTFSTPNTPGRKSSITSISPEVPGLTIHNDVTASERRGDNAYIYGAPYSYDRFATGTLPAGSPKFLVKGSIPDPEKQFAYELQMVLSKHGITFSGGFQTGRQLELNSANIDYEKRKLLFEHHGEKLVDIITVTNLRSVNLFAEHMISLVGYEKTGNGSLESGLDVLEKHWNTRIDTKGLFITDGSGLSRTNGISAHHFCQLLAYMKQSKNGKDFFNTLPTAGQSGTLVNVCKDQTAHGRLTAKSGSMSRIRSYAGYIKTTSGKELAFALIVNNPNCSSSVLKRKMEIVFNKLAAY